MTDVSQVPMTDVSQVLRPEVVQSNIVSFAPEVLMAALPNSVPPPPEPSVGGAGAPAPQHRHSVFFPPPGAVHKPIPDEASLRQLSPFTGEYKGEEIINRWTSRRKPTRSRNLKTPSRLGFLASVSSLMIVSQLVNTQCILVGSS
jgi:hypothetical protein